jgi:hypothetical protein
VVAVRPDRQRNALLAVLAVGGIAVLAGYAHGYLTYPGIRWDIWGGIPSWMRPIYTISMFGAAAGYFPFTLFVVLRLDPQRVRFGSHLGYGLVLLLYGLVLAGSAAWTPLTYMMLESPSPLVWVAIRVVLGVVAAASLGLLVVFLTLEQREPAVWYRLSIAGLALFCWQTVVLDALVWPHFFPL